MASNVLLEKASDIVIAHVTSTSLSTDELLGEIERVYEKLQKLDSGRVSATQTAATAAASTTVAAAAEAPAEEQVHEEEREETPLIPLKKAFQQDQVICMICGKGNMQTLTRHLNQAHQMAPKQYRKKFGIPKSQPLTSKNLSETRQAMAKGRGLSNNLANARQVRLEKLAEKKRQEAPESQAGNAASTGAPAHPEKTGASSKGGQGHAAAKGAAKSNAKAPEASAKRGPGRPKGSPNKPRAASPHKQRPPQRKGAH